MHTIQNTSLKICNFLEGLGLLYSPPLEGLGEAFSATNANEASQ
jgi:hypothetical protein